VLGTIFDLDWSDSDQRLELRLLEGGVAVRGPHLNGDIRVTAGQKLVAYANTGKLELSQLDYENTTDGPGPETKESKQMALSDDPRPKAMESKRVLPPTRPRTDWHLKSNSSRPVPIGRRHQEDGSGNSSVASTQPETSRIESILENSPLADMEDELLKATPSPSPRTDQHQKSQAKSSQSRSRRAEAMLELPTPDDEDDEPMNNALYSEPQADVSRAEVLSHPGLSWTELSASGAFRAILFQASARGLERTFKQASLKDLVALADAARYSGDRVLARRALLAQHERFSSSVEANRAAFLLGRIADDEGAYREALRWYETYLRRSPRGAFSAEALGRKLDIVVRFGNRKRAVKLADQYLELYPRGVHADYAREVLKRP
jgi:TolA-binding protein